MRGSYAKYRGFSEGIPVLLEPEVANLRFPLGTGGHSMACPSILDDDRQVDGESGARSWEKFIDALEPAVMVTARTAAQRRQQVAARLVLGMEVYTGIPPVRGIQVCEVEACETLQQTFRRVNVPTGVLFPPVKPVLGRVGVQMHLSGGGRQRKPVPGEGPDCLRERGVLVHRLEPPGQKVGHQVSVLHR